MDPMWLRRSRNGATIVFVHGILSGSVTAWTNPNGTFWPRLLIDDERLDDFGVYLFAYRADALAGTYSLEDAVDVMREHFRLDGLLARGAKEPLIFVCHSMGGIVARRFVVANQLALAECDNPLAFFLIASPSLGSEYANFVAAVAPLYNAQLNILKIGQKNHWLNTLDRDFMNLKEGGRLIIKGKELVEDQFFANSSLLRFDQIVRPWTGARYFGDPIKIPRSDHISIAKPSGPSDLQHRLLVEFICTVCGEKSLKTPSDRKAESENRLVVDWNALLPDKESGSVASPRRKIATATAAAVASGFVALLSGAAWWWLQPAIGEVTIEFTNTTDQQVKVSDRGEYYITEPESPGSNRRVDAGVLRLMDPAYDNSGWAFNIPSGARQAIKARFANEDKLAKYYVRGDMFATLIFSAMPRPIRGEFNFDKRTFASGLKFVISSKSPIVQVPKDKLSRARVVVGVGPGQSSDVQQMISTHLGNAGIIISGYVGIEGRPNAPLCELVYYNDEDEQLAQAIKSDLDPRLSHPMSIVKATTARAKEGVIDIFLDKITLQLN
jgi:pimeloyl-ACP methyl ester carboxylesterase